MDELVNLCEELDLANTTAPAFQVVAGAKSLPLCVMIANTARDLADFLNRAKIDGAPPDEGPNGIDEALAKRDVARSGARADEGGAFPGKRCRFIIAQRSVDRQRQGRHFGRRPQPQVDAKDKAVLIASLEQFDNPPGDTHGGLDRLLARAVRQGLRIEDQDRIDIR